MSEIEKALIGKKLNFQNKTCLIRERKQTTKKKPALFLINITDKKYISSLYKMPGSGGFVFEYEGKHYILDSESLKISQDATGESWSKYGAYSLSCEV